MASSSGKSRQDAPPWLRSIDISISTMFLLMLTPSSEAFWECPLVDAIPIDAEDAISQGYNMDALGSTVSLARNTISGLLRDLNTNYEGVFVWTAYRLKVCDDGGLLFTVKAEPTRRKTAY